MIAHADDPNLLGPDQTGSCLQLGLAPATAGVFMIEIIYIARRIIGHGLSNRRFAPRQSGPVKPQRKPLGPNYMIRRGDTAQGEFGHIGAFQKTHVIGPNIQHGQALAGHGPAQHRQQSRNIGGHHRHGISRAGAALGEPCLDRIGMHDQPIIG